MISASARVTSALLAAAVAEARIAESISPLTAMPAVELTAAHHLGTEASYRHHHCLGCHISINSRMHGRSSKPTGIGVANEHSAMVDRFWRTRRRADARLTCVCRDQRRVLLWCSRSNKQRDCRMWQRPSGQRMGRLCDSRTHLKSLTDDKQQSSAHLEVSVCPGIHDGCRSLGLKLGARKDSVDPGVCMWHVKPRIFHDKIIEYLMVSGFETLDQYPLVLAHACGNVVARFRKV